MIIEFFGRSGIYTCVRCIRKQLGWLGLILAFLWPESLHAGKTEARLLLAVREAQAGGTVMAGVHLKMAHGWHTYWRNAGDAGAPTKIVWQLPDGVTAGEIHWPPPEKYETTGLFTYVYHDEVILLVPLTLAPELPAGQISIRADVSWLECEDICVPGKAKVEAGLVIGSRTVSSAEEPLIKSWEARLPHPPETPMNAAWGKPIDGKTRPVYLQWKSAEGSPVDFFPYESKTYEVKPETDRLSAEAGFVRLRKMVEKFGGEWPSELAGLIVRQSGTGEVLEAHAVSVPVVDGGAVAFEAEKPRVESAELPAKGTGQPAPSLAMMLLYAFVGGLILNIMPCVLPVIALKILGFVGQAKDEPGQVRKLGLVYTAGVLASFLALALIVIGFKAAGDRVGWGFQFGNPYFLVVMTTLVVVIALNLFGVFEITLGGGMMGAAADLSSKSGPGGAFFSGLLATLLATSCTAPVLGAAVGYAFAQTPVVIVAMMLMVGVGLASPYVVLSWHPAWLRFLPKPGVWMEKFKIAMGFPMLAGGVWLFSLLSTHYGDRSWWLAMFLIFLALALWVYGEFVQRGRKRRVLAAIVSLALLATGYVWVLDGQLRWRSPGVASENAGKLAHAPEGYDWQPWSTDAVVNARSQGRPVLVDFTAKWCLTCNTVVKPALESKAVVEKLQETGTVALLADYTAFPPEITDELARFNRAGVPLVLVYPRNPNEPPIVLPEALTPGMVVNALEKAARKGG